MDNYNPTEYWLKRGETYHTELPRGWGPKEQRQLLDCLNGIYFNRVLEVGCGYGRVTKWVNDRFGPETYDAIDLSPAQITWAKQSVRGVNFAVQTIQNFNATEHYDLVLAVEVLLHILPSEIEQTISKLLRLGKHLVQVDPIKGENLHPHNFIHDYQAIYNKLGKTADIIEIGTTGQYIIHVY